MLNIPMNKQDLREEEDMIFEIAKVYGKKGYGRSLIQNLIEKHKRKLHVRDLTSSEEIKQERIRMKLNYYSQIEDNLTKVLRSVNIEPIFRSGNKANNRLCNKKDKVENCNKSG